MALSPQWLDELRARLTLSSVVMRTTKLQRAGSEWKACCPFHDEKTPSFTVSDSKGFYHCFGCGAHGDVIRWMTDQRGLAFMDAVKELAAEAGLEVPAPDPRAAQKAEQQAGLHEVMAAAQDFFRASLDTPGGEKARAYLKSRGFDAHTEQRFGFGFAPNARNAITAALKQFDRAMLVEAGLLIAVDDKEPYDRFRDRLTIPIHDPRGRVIGFAARILDADKKDAPKYLNSPDTPLFDKGRTLFNLDLAGPASRKANRILIVEGQMDVIALDQAGIGEVVAPLGTALTEAQLERLWRLEPAPICCFDGDSAGQKAAVRAAVRALPHLGPERTLRFVALLAGQDPDDVVKSGGREAMEALLAAAEPLVERLWRHEVDAAPLDTPEARAGLKQRLLDHVATIGDPSLRQLYRDEWLKRFDALVRPQRASGGPFTPRTPWKKNRDGRFMPPEAPPSSAARNIGVSGIDRATARALVLGHALYPQAISDHVEALATLPIPDPAAAAVRDRMVDLALAGETLDRDALATILAADETAGPWRDVSKGGDIGFSFIRGDSEPESARRDLGLAIEALAATAEIEAALGAATQRLIAGDDSAFIEQQRLHAAREAIKERLAHLASNE